MLTLDLEPLDEPLVEGKTRWLALGARAGAGAVALLGNAREARSPGGHSWRRRPQGQVLYDARSDRYLHDSSSVGEAPVPLHAGVVPSGLRAEAFVPARALESGRVTLTFVVRYREVAPGSLTTRLYFPPEAGVEGSRVIYRPSSERAARAAVRPPGRVIAREGDLPLLEARLEVSVDVTPDERAPGVDAARRGRLLARPGALGFAWVIATAAGGHEILLPEGPLALAPGRLAPEALETLEAHSPAEALVVVFRGAAGARVREELALGAGPVAQAAVPPEAVPRLLAAVERAGATLLRGLPWEGLVVA